MKKLFYTIAIIVAAASFASCNKFLDVNPDNRTELNSLDKVKSVLVSAYPNKEYASFLDVRCDGMMDHGSTMDGTQMSIRFDCIRNNFLWDEYSTFESDIDAQAYWSTCYEAIACANAALDAVDRLSPAEQKAAAPYIGEALLCRAYCHFQLLTLFSNFFDETKRDSNPGIPYVTEIETVINKHYDRETVSATLKKVKADYEEGIKLAGNASDFAQPKFHFGHDAGVMLGIRIALYERNYAEVINLVNTLIPNPTNIRKYNITGGGSFTIPAPDDLAYVFCGAKLFDWYDARTNISGSTPLKQAFSNASNANIILMSEPYSLLGRVAGSTTYVSFAPSAKDFSSYTNNATTYNWCYPSYSYNIARTNDPSFIPKIYEDFHVTNISANTGQPYVRFALFRLEEALLARAEAYAMTGEYDKALWDLDMYTQERVTAAYPNFWWSKERVLAYYYESGKYDITNLFVDNKFNAGRFTTDKESEEGMFQRALIMSILDARRSEYIYEGMRYFDILRWNIPVTHRRASGESSTLTPDDDRRVLQIPASTELSGLEKNPYSHINPWQ